MRQRASLLGGCRAKGTTARQEHPWPPAAASRSRAHAMLVRCDDWCPKLCRAIEPLSCVQPRGLLPASPIRPPAAAIASGRVHAKRTQRLACPASPSETASSRSLLARSFGESYPAEPFSLRIVRPRVPLFTGWRQRCNPALGGLQRVASPGWATVHVVDAHALLGCMPGGLCGPCCGRTIACARWPAEPPHIILPGPYVQPAVAACLPSICCCI